MFRSYRQCPKCGIKVEHTTSKSQKNADRLAANSTKDNKLCRSCIATEVNNRRWQDPIQLQKQSQRFSFNNPSKGKPAWNKGIPRDEVTKTKIKDTKRKNGGSSGDRNANYGNFKYHNTQEDFKNFRNRVVVLTERVKHLINGYDNSKRGRTNVSGSFQIDHINPIIDCWYESWTPEQTANLDNLRFVSWQENLKFRKWRKNKEYLK